MVSQAGVPRVFISYAHASKEHKAWVKKLSDALRRRSVDTTLDQDDLHLGQLIATFQEKGIKMADRVLVVCSDAYVEKCDTPIADSGAAQEKRLMAGELQRDPATSKFIPILRDITSERRPTCLVGRLWIDASDDKSFRKIVDTLVKEVRREWSSQDA
jgi:TIR domain